MAEGFALHDRMKGRFWPLSLGLAVILLIASGWWFGDREADRHDQEMREEVLRSAIYVAGTVDPALVGQLTFTPGDRDIPAYQRIREQMNGAVGEITHAGVYSLALRGDHILFGPETYPLNDPASSAPGSEFRQAGPQYRAIFRDHDPVVFGPQEDEFGTWVTALAPVMDGSGSHVVLVVGVDVPASEWNRSLNIVRIRPLILTGLLAVFLVAASMLAYHGLRRLSPTNIQVRVWVITPSVIAVLVAAIFYGLYEYHVYTQDSHLRLHSLHDQVQDKWNTLYGVQVQSLRSVHDRFMLDAGMERAWVRGDAGALRSVAAQRFEEMKFDVGINQLFCITPDGTCLARGHKPAVFGDRIDRPTFLLSRASGEDSWGTELGSRGKLSLRYTRPWTVRGRQIGYLEIGKNIEAIVQRFAISMHLDAIVILHKRSVDREEVEQGVRNNYIAGDWETYPAGVVVQSTLKGVPREIEELLREGRNNGPTARVLVAHHGDHVYGCGFIPVNDPHGNEILSLITLTDVTREQDAAGNGILISLGFWVVLLGSVIAFLWIVSGKIQDQLMNMFAQIQEGESRMRAITGSAQDGIIMIDPHGTVSFWNPAAERIFGYSAADVIGKDLHKILAPERYTVGYRDAFAEFQSSGTGAGIGKILEVEALAKDGREVPVQLALSAVRLNDGWHAIGLVRDITEQRKYEAEREAAHLELNEALMEVREANEALKETTARAHALAGQAEAANVAKSQFLANMSHEIRTPMNGIIGMTGLLIDSPLNPEQRQFVDVVRTSSEALLALINDILDFSKIEAHKIELDDQEFNLHTILEETTELLAVKAHEKDLHIVCLIDPNVPQVVRGDPGRVRQVLLNLGGNAVKFTHEGGVTLHACLDRIEEGRPVVRFAITDSGVGIPQEKQQKLFTPFTQVDGSITRRYGGTGLGLAISMQLAELMGGEIGMESPARSPITKEEQRGSMFWFTVRFAPVEHAIPDVSGPASILEGVRVLVVDDSEANRFLVRTLLHNWGCRSGEAISGEHALEVLEEALNSGDPYQFALMDMAMPGIDGAETGKRVKASRRLMDTHLVMLTSLGERGDRQRILETGFAAYFTKPFRQNHLKEAMEAILGGKGTDVTPEDAPPKRAAAEPSPARILIAEDNPINQLVALKILAKLGYRAETVSNGAEAVEAVTSGSYDIILMDCQMPEMDGFEATRTLRGQNREIPIIAMTANAMKGDRELCLESGMNDYLSKPVKSGELAAMLERWLPPTRP